MERHMHAITRAAMAALAVAGLTVALAACKPEPSPTSTPGGGPTPTSSRSTSTPSVSVTPTATPTVTETPTPTPVPTASADDIAVPGACEDIYSAGMRSTLEAKIPVLNDPGVTMYSTQVVEALEMLGSGAPTIRCSWGRPSEFGLATNVTVVDAGQRVAVMAALGNAGFTCAAAHGGTLCTLEEKFITQDDSEVHRNEAHFLRGNGWVSTQMLNFSLDGYTDDIVDNVWG